ncbi:hypothetical protein CHS0354_003250 [Potamilus streckersoni]|uniref:Uncharacterized protein n=1 Tax=Potamilus streckersoni TaxID=2493646 RepID=A0AAE0W1K6_9BIVA|nr:hypothetical protein CHS0354_003250 [Potamilus streckersoni]
MSFNHVNVTLTPGQIDNSKTLIKQKKSNKDAKLDLSAAAIKDTFKTGGIFPLLAAIPALIAAAAPAVAKAAALGAVGTAAGMALKKATGQGMKRTFKKREKVSDYQ